ncbi:MAG: (deoxy)nucleoside triphosphate pyrophosphohydrolase [Bryobacteraceae bacterium]
MTTVVAAIVERDGRVLICRRAPGDRHPGKWEFPGGKAEPREALRTALARELREELDIAAEIGDEVERYEYAYPGRDPIRLVFFRVREFTGEPRNLVFGEIRWERLERLPEFDFLEGDVAFVQRLAGIRKSTPRSRLSRVESSTSTRSSDN